MEEVKPMGIKEQILNKEDLNLFCEEYDRIREEKYILENY